MALNGGGWSTSHPSRFTPGERAPSTHLIGGWVGPRTDLDAIAKREDPSPYSESSPGCPARSLVSFNPI